MNALELLRKAKERRKIPKHLRTKNYPYSDVTVTAIYKVDKTIALCEKIHAISRELFFTHESDELNRIRLLKDILQLAKEIVAGEPLGDTVANQKGA